MRGQPRGESCLRERGNCLLYMCVCAVCVCAFTVCVCACRIVSLRTRANIPFGCFCRGCDWNFSCCCCCCACLVLSLLLLLLLSALWQFLQHCSRISFWRVASLWVRLRLRQQMQRAALARGHTPRAVKESQSSLSGLGLSLSLSLPENCCVQRGGLKKI